LIKSKKLTLVMISFRSVSFRAVWFRSFLVRRASPFSRADHRAFVLSKYSFLARENKSCIQGLSVRWCGVFPTKNPQQANDRHKVSVRVANPKQNRRL